MKTKFNYERINGPNSFNFRLIVIDFAWALVHSVLGIFTPGLRLAQRIL